MAIPYTFRAATPLDAALMQRWRSAPHVRAWWGDPDPTTPTVFDDARVLKWIVEVQGRPVAYLQDYAVHGWEDHHFAHLPPGSRGIDIYIGEADMIGRGHGTTILAAKTKGLFGAGAPVIATDPHPDNMRAIAAYQKAGFRIAGVPQDTRWGRIMPMHALAADVCSTGEDEGR